MGSAQSSSVAQEGGSTTAENVNLTATIPGSVDKNDNEDESATATGAATAAAAADHGGADESAAPASTSAAAGNGGENNGTSEGGGKGGKVRDAWDMISPDADNVVDLAAMKDAVWYLFEDRNQRLSKFFLLISLAAVIATVGVANDSAATVIGAMIVGTFLLLHVHALLLCQMTRCFLSFVR